MQVAKAFPRGTTPFTAHVLVRNFHLWRRRKSHCDCAAMYTGVLVILFKFIVCIHRRLFNTQVDNCHPKTLAVTLRNSLSLKE